MNVVASFLFTLGLEISHLHLACPVCILFGSRKHETTKRRRLQHFTIALPVAICNNSAPFKEDHFFGQEAEHETVLVRFASTHR